MKPKVKGPFTDEDVRVWNEALRKCEKAREECELGIQAGFPCHDQLQACQAIKEQLTAMKQTYAPHLP